MTINEILIAVRIWTIASHCQKNLCSHNATVPTQQGAWVQKAAYVSFKD